MTKTEQKETEKKERKKSKPTTQYTLYPPHIVDNTLAIYATNNNLTLTSKLTNVSASTIAQWRDKQKKDYSELREIAQQRLISGASSIIDKALTQIETSIEAGYNDPYKLTLMVGILYDKRALAQGDSTFNSSTIVKIEDFPEVKA